MAQILLSIVAANFLVFGLTATRQSSDEKSFRDLLSQLTASTGDDSVNGDEIGTETESVGGIAARKPEKEYNVGLKGFQAVSGGAGEGDQQVLPNGSVSNEVKTDAYLPSYCSPPNPCPKGLTAAEGCQENIPDTAVFNKHYIMREMLEGRCACDYEHMLSSSCPHADNLDLDYAKVDDYHSYTKNPYMAVGEKRLSMQAKKGNKVVKERSIPNSGLMENPYLAGEKLPVVAKKSPRMQEK